MHVDPVAALDGGRRGQVATAAGRDDRPDGAQGPTGQAGHAGGRRCQILSKWRFVMKVAASALARGR